MRVFHSPLFYHGRLLCLCHRQEQFTPNRVLLYFPRKIQSQVSRLTFCYTDASGLQTSPKIGPFKSIKGNQAKLKVKVRLNLHGIVSVDSTTMLEDEEVEVSVPVAKDSFKEAPKMDIDEGITNSSATTAECDVHMHEVKRETDSSSPAVENGVPETEEKSTHMETNTKVREQGSIELQNTEDQAKQKGRGRWSKGPGASFEAAISELPPSAIGDVGHYDAIGFLAANKGKPMKRHCCSYVKSRVFFLRVQV